MSSFEQEEVVPSAPAGRYDGVIRPYSIDDVKRLRGSITIDYTLATRGSNKLWAILHEKSYINALGAYTGCMAVQMVKAGLEAIYLSGWQVAADNNTAGAMYPDQSLYPADSAPDVCRRINRAFKRQDEIEVAEGHVTRDYFVPIVADAEAGFGGPLNAFELMKSFIEAGAAAVHFEDQLSSEKKCGHLGGKVLIPIAQHEKILAAARLAADICGVPTLIVARTDAESARLITSDADERDIPFIVPGSRTAEGYFRLNENTGLQHCIARGLAYAPLSDILWFETSHPDVQDAKTFAEAIHRVFPGKLLAYNCSPSFNWASHMNNEEMEAFQRTIASFGYKFQFVTLAGFHALNLSIFELAMGYRQTGMEAYSRLVQQREFALETNGYTATRHQREVGTGYFDQVTLAVSRGLSSTTAMSASTESSQFTSPAGSPLRHH